MNPILYKHALHCDTCSGQRIVSWRLLHVLDDGQNFICSHCGNTLCAKRPSAPVEVAQILAGLARRKLFHMTDEAKFRAETPHPTHPSTFQLSLRSFVGTIPLAIYDEEKQGDIAGTMSFSYHDAATAGTPSGTPGYRREDFQCFIPDSVDTAVHDIVAQTNKMPHLRSPAYVSIVKINETTVGLRVVFSAGVQTDHSRYIGPSGTLRHGTIPIHKDEVTIVRLEFSWNISNAPKEFYISVMTSDVPALLAGDLSTVLEKYNVTANCDLGKAHRGAVCGKNAWYTDFCLLRIAHDPYEIAFKLALAASPTIPVANLHQFIATSFRVDAIMIGGRDKLKLIWGDLKPHEISIIPSPEALWKKKAE